MLQYLYFHTGKEYVSRLSIGRDNDDFSDRENLFEVVRKATEGNTFLFAPLNGEEFFMQSAQGSNGLFVKGLRGKALTNADVPSKYIDKFETRVQPALINASVLPEGTLPAAGRLADSFALARDLHHIFPKLIDVLLYGESDRKIVIIAESREKAVNYVKVLSLLLPPSYMRKVGFCIGCNNIPYEELSITKNNGEQEVLPVRIWVSDMTNYDFGSLATFYYVFDTKTHNDNYNAELSVTAKALAEVNLANQMQAGEFARYISQAFDSLGNVDFKKLEKLSAMYLFELKRDVQSAKEILKLDYNENEIQERAVTSAIQFLLQIENLSQLTLQEKNTIVGAYRNNANIAQSVEELLFSYFASTVKNLTAEEKALFGEMIARDLSGDRLSTFLQSSFRGDFTSMKECFDVTCTVLGTALSAQGYGVYPVKELLKVAVNFFNIGNCYRLVPNNQLKSGEEYFDIIANCNNDELKRFMAAVLMASVYIQSPPAAQCDIRINGFKKLISRISDKNLDKFDFILSVRNKIIEISDAVPDLDIDSQADFLFENKSGKLWVTSLIGGMSLDEMLDADVIVKNRSVGTFYESMASAIEQRLLDIKYVQENVKSGTEEAKSYLNFFRLLPEETQSRFADVAAYLSALGHETEINDEFSKYRYDFALSCYDTMSAVNKSQIQGGEEPLKQFEETSKQERLRIVEDTIKVFGEIEGHKKKGRLKYSGIVICAFFSALLAMALLCIPALVIPASLGNLSSATFADKFVYYFKPYLFAIPVAVFLIDIISYVFLKRGNKLLRANIITFACGILPTLAFVLGIIVFYFVRINLPF